jgi:pimeloyl-ACP methyl ester carboxylesterase
VHSTIGQTAYNIHSLAPNITRARGACIVPVQQAAIAVDGARVVVLRAGRGQPLVFLDSVDDRSGGAEWLPVHDRLAEHFDVVVPVRPAAAELGEWPLASVDDCVVFYRCVLDALGLPSPHVVAVSAAGWIAAELAARCSHGLASLVLADAPGLRLASEPPPDIFALPFDRVRPLLLSDTASGSAGGAALPDVELRSRLRFLARIGWNPYLHDPKLARRLGLVRAPALVLWGGEDRLFSPRYAAAFARAIPGARSAVIAHSGHLPALERPDEFADLVARFAGDRR